MSETGTICAVHIINTSTNVMRLLAGTYGTCGADNGSGAAAKFASPNAVAVDASGNVYVTGKKLF